LNECADQLATRGVQGSADFSRAMMAETPPDEIESTEEFVLNEDENTRTEGWHEEDHIAPGTIRVRSVGLALKEEKETRDETFNRFAHDFLGGSSDSPKASNSEVRVC
jgi:hypothetical protein